MVDPLTVTLAGLLTAKALEETVKAIVKDVYKESKNAAFIALDRNPGKLAALVEKLASVRLVKTIWQVDKEVDLQEFYHPTHVIADGKKKLVTSLDGISRANCLIFEGIVGQGKSIFLRHLACQELMQGKRIPLFIELRRLSGSRPLMTAILSKMVDLGLPGDEELFMHFANKRRAVLLLDAFDELDDKCVKDVLNEIDSLRERAPELQIVVTSRPDTAVCHSPLFRIHRLARVELGEIKSLIARLTNDPDFLDNIMTSLHAAKGIHGILVTPLMVTLLVVSFKAYGSLPESLSGFYEALVPLLLSRHDQTKPGYIRPKRCGLSDHRIRQVFEALCFVTKQRVGKPSLTEREIHDCATMALTLSRNTCDESAFVKDVVRVTCLLLEEGGSYSFLHTSVQEFGAAMYVRQLTDEAASTFYGQMLTGKWRHWQVELSFLCDIDSYRYSKHFLVGDLVKSISRLFKVSHDNINSISDAVLRRFLRQFNIAQRVALDRRESSYMFSMFDRGTELEWCLYRRWTTQEASVRAMLKCVTKEVVTQFMKKSKKGGAAVAIVECTFEDLYKAGVLPDEAKNAATRVLQSLLDERNVVSAAIKRQEDEDRRAVELV